MADLFNNPITIIALSLAGFFILMAIVRQHIARRASKATETPKPFAVSDPYNSAAPAPAQPTLNPVPAPAAKTEAAAPNSKFFRRFGDDVPGKPRISTSEYIWE